MFIDNIPRFDTFKAFPWREYLYNGYRISNYIFKEEHIMKQLVFIVFAIVAWAITTWLWIPVMTEFLGTLNLFIHIIGALMYGALLGLFALPYLFTQQKFMAWKAMLTIIVVATVIMFIISIV